MILDTFPNIQDFYQNYWNKKPFIVRKAIDKQLFADLIDGDTLAGLALEEDIKSRLVVTNDNGNDWQCTHGPLADDAFSKLEDKNWSLLVQNVEQYHPPTAKLLESFHFSPRWLMDDIMVSYSTAGGSVGPHYDSYHVFLTQGIGTRKWKIGNTPIEQADHIDNPDLLVLKNDFDGQEHEVTMGDVIYIPPFFAHRGDTLEEAMTFSVGFLGPKLSEMMAEYSHYLEQSPELNTRYIGQGLDAKSAGFSIAQNATSHVQNMLTGALNQDHFATWLAEYFSSTATDEDEDEPGEFTQDDLLEDLQAGDVLQRPEALKLAITTLPNGSFTLAANGESSFLPERLSDLTDWLNTNHAITFDDLDTHPHKSELTQHILMLYNKNIISFD
jgi:50S ribosomal protein L16 3-hydroxylase